MKSIKHNLKKVDSIYELPRDVWEDLERFSGNCNVWYGPVEIELEEDDPPIPIDLMGTLLKEAIEKNEYEQAESIHKELIERGYNVEIKVEENGGTLVIQKNSKQK